jgi:formylglycine-generating enzyme required for sulfatase activity
MERSWNAAGVAALVLMTAPTLAAPIDLGAFSIDQTEVTVDAFAQFAARTGMVTQAQTHGGGFEWGAGWERRAGWTYLTPDGDPAQSAAPAVHVSHAEASAYCADAGGRLPTRSEWSLAAYTEMRPAPKEGLETGFQSEFKAGRTYIYPVGDSPEGMNTNRSHHVPVATTKQGVNGLYDMGANVWEWLADRQGDQALTAGGSWWYGPPAARVEGMQWKPAEFYAVYVGFRCVYD